MTTSIKTITSLQESNAFRKTPELLGGKASGGNEEITGEGVLRIPITFGVWLQLITGMQKYYLPACDYWKKRLIKKGQPTKRKLIEFYHIKKNGSQLTSIVEFEGFKKAPYPMSIVQGDYTRQVKTGDFVLMLGKKLK